MTEHLDWSDMCLNTCGAVCGALPWTSLARLKRYAQGKEDVFEAGESAPRAPRDRRHRRDRRLPEDVLHARSRSALAVPRQLDKHKPFHQFTQKEGIPALLALATLNYYVVDERRKAAMPVGVFVAVLVAWHVGLTLPTDQGEVIHEDVLRVTVPHAKRPIAIDGKLDEADWKNALKIELKSFAPDATEEDRAKRPMEFGAELRQRRGFSGTNRRSTWAFSARRRTSGRTTSPGTARGSRTSRASRSSSTRRRRADLLRVRGLGGEPAGRLLLLHTRDPQWVPWPSQSASREPPRGSGLEAPQDGGLGAGRRRVRPDQAGGPSVPRKEATLGYTVGMAIPWADMKKGRWVSPDFHTGASPVKPGARFRANFYRVETYRKVSPAPGTSHGLEPDARAARLPQTAAFRRAHARRMSAPPHVVVVGGGFGGLNAARALAKAPCRVTLVDRRNHRPSSRSSTRWRRPS